MLALRFGSIDALTPLLLSLDKRIALVADRLVGELYGKSLVQKWQKAGLSLSLLTFPQGESSKTRHEKELLENALLEQGFGRDSLLLSLGGGVTSDLAGFVAATYLRGIPWIAIPTTLLAMVDAAIGGKTGVNTLQGKNVIGAFHAPECVWIDTQFLSTLPQKEWRCGFAEVIKYGVIADGELFAELERGMAFSDALVQRAALLKQQIIDRDPLEKNRRLLLNFGHTVAHALEQRENYRICHGDAVAIGIVVESFLSFAMGLLSENACLRIGELVKRFGFTLQSLGDPASLMTAMASDKKSLGGQVRFVLPKTIGDVALFDGNYATVVHSEIAMKAFALYEHFAHHPRSLSGSGTDSSFEVAHHACAPLCDDGQRNEQNPRVSPLS